MQEVRKSGTTLYINDYRQRNMHKEVVELGIADAPCYNHCSESLGVVIIRPDSSLPEAKCFRDKLKGYKCEKCGWIIYGKKIAADLH
jgi:hypothetical protein